LIRKRESDEAGADFGEKDLGGESFTPRSMKGKPSGITANKGRGFDSKKSRRRLRKNEKSVPPPNWSPGDGGKKSRPQRSRIQQRIKEKSQAHRFKKRKMESEVSE